jgi:hypothetical protein
MNLKSTALRPELLRRGVALSRLTDRFLLIASLDQFPRNCRQIAE